MGAARLRIHVFRNASSSTQQNNNYACWSDTEHGFNKSVHVYFKGEIGHLLSFSSSESEISTPPSQMITLSGHKRTQSQWNASHQAEGRTKSWRRWQTGKQLSDVRLTNIILCSSRAVRGEPTGSEVGHHHFEAGAQVDRLGWDQVTEEGHVLLHHSLATAHPWKPLDKTYTKPEKTFKMLTQVNEYLGHR